MGAQISVHLTHGYFAAALRTPTVLQVEFASIEGPRCARSAFTSRTVSRGRQPAGAGPLLRAGPWVTAAADRAGKPLRASRKAGPQSTTAECDAGAPLRCRGETEKPRSRSRPQPPRGSAGSPGGPDTVRVETDSIAQHRAGNAEQAVGHRAQGARVSVAAGT